MTGNNKKAVVIQERDRLLFRELSRMRVIDREQVKVVAGFRSTTAVNLRLSKLLHAGFLRRIFIGTAPGNKKALYTLSSTSAALVGDDRSRKSLSLSGTLGLEHQLAVNAIYLTIKFHPIAVNDLRFERWITFRQPLPGTALIPDGYFELQSPTGIHPMFLEVDLGTEVSRIWRDKTAAYLQLATSGQFEKLFHQSRFRVLVVATTRRRLETIRSSVAKSTEKIFWFSNFEQIKGNSFWASVWLRPKGNQLQSLF
ncbi:MAG TPA: replication-relaxation family protein [Acidobacteriota bacterium]|jgi:hypothetical protein